MSEDSQAPTNPDQQPKQPAQQEQPQTQPMQQPAQPDQPQPTQQIPSNPDQPLQQQPMQPQPDQPQPLQYQQGQPQQGQYQPVPSQPQPVPHPQQPVHPPVSNQQGYQSQQPYPGQQVPVGGYGYQYNTPQPPIASYRHASSGKAIGALVCGILAIVLSPTIFFGLVLGIIAIVLAVQYSRAVKGSGIPADGKATGGKACGIIGIVLSIIALICYIGFFVFFAAVIDKYEYNSGTYSYSIPDSGPGSGPSIDGTDKDEQAIVAATEEALKSMANPARADIDALALKYEDEFKSFMGFSMTEAGIEPASVIQLCANDIEYNVDSVYTHTNTATSYVEVCSNDIWSYLNTFAEDLAELQKQGTAPQIGPNSPDKARIGELFLAAMSKAEPTEKYVVLEFNKNKDAWLIDPASFEEEIDFVYGIYS